MTPLLYGVCVQQNVTYRYQTTNCQYANKQTELKTNILLHTLKISTNTRVQNKHHTVPNVS